MTVRAIHMEIVQDLSTSSLLNAFRRFVSRREFPKLIVSDNGSYFKMASKFLTKDSDLTINSCEVSKFLHKHDIVWKFIIEYAPWYGWFYERLVKNIKNSLKCLTYNRKISFEHYQTILVEVESILNKRPLTYIDDDQESIILRPCLFLSHNNILKSFRCESDEHEKGLAIKMTKNDLKLMWSVGSKLLDIFWK
ncbi:hypothetical protein RF11_05300 [Thelohanellus kitauei]|uniref:Integrase catalytic domain-containing protein n=1 Tax=Thelohanellus kitauei TaxID=669202 RepID=A0A0C2N526_THEKT|nr:hypothetical protein RF11_05300 [Thelohanellus kitauei]